MRRGFDDSHEYMDYLSRMNDWLDQQSVLEQAMLLSSSLADVYSDVAANRSLLNVQRDLAVEIAEAVGRIPDIAQRSLRESAIFADENIPLSLLDQVEIPDYISGVSESLLSSLASNRGLSEFCMQIPEDSYRALQNVIPDMNLEMLAAVADRVLSGEAYTGKDWDLDEVSAAIAGAYDAESAPGWDEDWILAEDEVGYGTNCGDESFSAQKKDEKKKADPKEIRAWLELLVKIIAIIAGLYGVTSVDISINNSFNTVEQANHYYIAEQERDASSLNVFQYRIVNRDVKARLKHDCHSQVTGHLREGQVVRVIDKYRKWIQIEWRDAEGESCFGWIQNYKVSEFKTL